MWLRDSANQMRSYLPLLRSNNSLASLYRGVINLQTRYLLTSPYCNSFQPPVESGIPPAVNDAAVNDNVTPPYSNASVFECKYELDSLAAFLQISTDYYSATGDADFFGSRWLDAVRAVMEVARAMMAQTYAPDGSVNVSPYTFQRQTTSGAETLANDGAGNPVRSTGLVRSAFRPSDDATIYQFLIPANMMFSNYLNSTAEIAPDLASEMTAMASSIREAIDSSVYELDGYGSANFMDDANIPSLLSAPLFGFSGEPRELLLSDRNPYFMRGPVINAIGGPHQGPGYAWPMASIVRILTSDDDAEITSTLKEIVASTDGLGLIHESINTFNQSDWTRQW